jgi:nicotinamide-nucleotide amidase
MQAILLAIGDELTSGQTVDTNSAWLAQQLARKGLRVGEHRTVRDVQSDIVEALRAAARRAEIVLVTGGLGPTADDLTRQALADTLGVELEIDEPSLARIQAFFARRNRPMNPGNRIQAMCPQGAQILDNPIGTAPGLSARLGEATVYCMPGVPREMRKMYSEIIAPRLPDGAGSILYASLHVAGMGESDVAAAIKDLMVRDGDVIVGTTATGGMVSARITARGEDVDGAREHIDATVREIRRRLGQAVVGQDQTTLAAAVGQLLDQRNQHLATAESCTGGLIAELVTDVPGSSGWFRGSIVAYDNEIKQAILDVDEQLLIDHGAVSEPVARAMAEGARRKLGCDWAVSTTGIAGPTGGTDEKPVGLVFVGIAGPKHKTVHRHNYPGDRSTMRLRTALGVLNHLRLALLKAGVVPAEG